MSRPFRVWASTILLVARSSGDKLAAEAIPA